jgi:hypothetical protein
MFKKILTIKNLIIATIATFTLIAFIGLGGYLAFNYDISKIQEATMKYWEEGAKTRAVYSKPDSVNAKKQVVINKYSSSEIVTTMVFIDKELPNGKDKIEWSIYYIHRTGLFQYKLDSFKVAGSVDYNFDQAVELAKKYDLNKENPDNNKIFNRPDLNLPPEQLQQELNYQAQYEALKIYHASYLAIPEDQRAKTCQDNLDKFKELYKASLTGEKVDGEVILAENQAMYLLAIDNFPMESCINPYK